MGPSEGQKVSILRVSDDENSMTQIISREGLSRRTAPVCQEKELRNIGPEKERKKEGIMNTGRKKSEKTEIKVEIRVKKCKEEGRKNKQRERKRNKRKNER
jgi:hypothetical protein